jgi:hypothetical protein
MPRSKATYLGIPGPLPVCFPLMPADGNFSPGGAAGIEENRQLAAGGVPWMATA